MSKQNTVSVIALADQLYRDRARPGAVKESVASLSGLANAERSYEAQWRLARALFFLGQESESNEAKRQLHAAAIGSGRRAASINSGRVEGHFWLGVNLALLAEASGGFKAAKAVITARRELKRAAAISESYHAAGPLRVLGRLLHKTPWFLGGSIAQGRQYLDRALALFPSNSVTIVYAAEAALDQGDGQRARSLLEGLLALSIDGEWEFEQRRDRDIARMMLSRISG